MKTHVNQFVMGVWAPMRGVSLILKHRRVRRLAVLPFVVAVVVFVAGLSWGLPFITGIVAPFAGWVLSVLGFAGPTWFSKTLGWLIPVVTWPVLACALLYVLWLCARLIASPFFALLAERVLIDEGAIEDGPFRLGPWIQLNLRMFVVSLMKTAVFAAIGAVLFVLSFIPGVGVLTGACFLMIVAFDLCDYSLEALQWGLSQRLMFFRSHPLVFLGIGCTLGVVLLVPGLNFFLLPAAVAGAADVVRRLTVAEENVPPRAAV